MCLHPYSVLNIHSTKPPEASRISLERCPAVSWWVFFQWHDFFFFFFPLPLHFLLSFIVMYIAYLAELQRELAGNQDNLSAQAAVRWWLSRGTVCLCSLLQRCSLTSFLEANLVFDIECVHSSSSSLFWWKGGCVLLWTSKHGVALQKLITQGTEALCDLRIMRLNLRRQLAIL